MSSHKRTSPDGMLIIKNCVKVMRLCILQCLSFLLLGFSLMSFITYFHHKT